MIKRICDRMVINEINQKIGHPDLLMKKKKIGMITIIQIIEIF